MLFHSRSIDIDGKFSVREAFSFRHDLKISQRERFGKWDV